MVWRRYRETFRVNQKKEAPDGHLLGTFAFDRSAEVTVSNKDTDGYVVVDAVRLVRRLRVP